MTSHGATENLARRSRNHKGDGYTAGKALVLDPNERGRPSVVGVARSGNRATTGSFRTAQPQGTREAGKSMRPRVTKEPGDRGSCLQESREAGRKSLSCKVRFAGMVSAPSFGPLRGTPRWLRSLSPGSFVTRGHTLLTRCRGFPEKTASSRETPCFPPDQRV
jgi:hypothetical protein